MELKGKQRVKSTWQKALNYFLRGLLVLLPIALTIGIIVWIMGALGRLINIDELSFKAFVFYAIGIIAFIISVGFITRGVVASQILDFFEGIIEKAPGLNFIFGTTRDMTEAFVGENKKFTRPVVIELTPGVKKMGFLTQENLNAIEMPEYVAVYLPFGYSIAGEMLIVHKDKVTPLHMDSGHVTKFVISGGATSLENNENAEQAKK